MIVGNTLHIISEAKQIGTVYININICKNIKPMTDNLHTKSSDVNRGT